MHFQMMKQLKTGNTSAFISLPGSGHAFIDGLKPDHECNSNGDINYWTASGKHVTWHTQRQWAHLTTEAREPLLYEHYSKIGDPICSASVSCSICKEAAINQAMWL